MNDLTINDLKQQISDLYEDTKKQIDSKLKFINNEIKQIKGYHENFYKKSLELISKLERENDSLPFSNSKLGLTSSEFSPITNSLIMNSQNQIKSKTPPKNKLNHNNINKDKKNNNEYYNELRKSSQNDLRHALLNHQKKKNTLQFKNPHESSSSHEFVLKKKKNKNSQNMGNTKEKKNNLNVYTSSSINNYSSQNKKKIDNNNNKTNPPISVSTEVISISPTLKKRNILNQFSNGKHFEREDLFDLNKYNNKNIREEFIDLNDNNENNINPNINTDHLNMNNEEFDLRKFSIIDIPSHNQMQERKKEISSSSNILKDEMKDFQTPTELCLYLCSKSNVVPFKTRIKLSKLMKNIYKLNSPSEILEDYINFLENLVKTLKNKLKIRFNPSFTARSEINFINAKDENEFYNYDTNDNIILCLIKCLLIIFNFNKDLNNFKCKELIKQIKNASNGKIRNFLISEERLKSFNELSLEKIDRFCELFHEIKDEVKNKQLPILLYKIFFFLQEIYPFFIDRSKKKKKFFNSLNELNKLKQNQFLSKME